MNYIHLMGGRVLRQDTRGISILLWRAEDSSSSPLPASPECQKYSYSRRWLFCPGVPKWGGYSCIGVRLLPRSTERQAHLVVRVHRCSGKSCEADYVALWPPNFCALMFRSKHVLDLWLRFLLFEKLFGSESMFVSSPTTSNITTMRSMGCVKDLMGI